ncbi:MAG: WYL domain-containing protein [Butyrivibrio sp.]|nr:WYL domain-containing protein [Butyrivibrio sp.]
MSEEKNKKGRLLALQEYFYQYTDEAHPASTAELIASMEKMGYKANRKTIKDDIDILIAFDIDIVTNVSRGNSFFMGNRQFEVPELKLLVDAVSSSRFISAGKSEKLIDKISSLGSIYQKEQIKPRIYAADRIKTDNPQLYYVIDKLIEAVQTNRQVRFQYTEYDADKSKVLRNDGEIYVNSPYGCLWNDDFYYLIGYSEKHQKVIAFRVDRIIDLEILDEPSLPKPENFVMSDYARKIIEMFDGEEQDVELVCDNGLMKSVIDKFGENIHTERINDDQFKVVVTVAASKTFYAWCFRFAGQMKIAGPRKVKKQYLEMAKKILE